MAVPATQNLTITRGDTEVIVINITSDGSAPIDVTGRTYRSQIRRTKDSGTVEAQLNCVITNAANGQVQATLSAGDSATLPVGPSFWDFEETNGSVVTTILAGTVTVLADVTR
jgi:hypothetical protein